jgi:hypothetical protein
MAHLQDMSRLGDVPVRSQTFPLSHHGMTGGYRRANGRRLNIHIKPIWTLDLIERRLKAVPERPQPALKYLCPRGARITFGYGSKHGPKKVFIVNPPMDQY